MRRSAGGGSVRKLFATDGDADTILEAQRNLSLLDPVAVVLVRDAGRLPAAECERLLASLDAPPGTPPLVFWDVSVDRRRKLFQEVAKRGGETNFAPPRAADAERWLLEEARRTGAKLQPAAAALLVDLLGANLLRLRSTLAMLALSVGEGGAIDRERVVDLVPEARSHALYELQDQMTARRGARAVALLREALDHGEGPEVLLGTLFAQLRRLLFARALRARVEPSQRKDRLVRETGTPAFKADALLEAAGRIAPGDLRRAFARLGDVDAAIKRGRADAVASLEAWLVDFCASREGAPRS